MDKEELWKTLSNGTMECDTCKDRAVMRYNLPCDTCSLLLKFDRRHNRVKYIDNPQDGKTNNWTRKPDG